MEKNTLQSAIDKCHNLLKFFTEKQVEKFEAVKVSDSEDLVEYGADLVVGTEVSISSSAGSVTAPDGEYKLVNGAVFTVKDGKVDAISKEIDAPVENEELAGEEPESKEEKPVDEAVKSEDVKVLEDKVSKLEDMVKALTEAVGLVPSAEDLNSFKSELTGVNKSIQKLSEIPTQLSADNRVELKETEIDKYKRIAALYSK
jgi:hypothetical protein